MTRWPALRSYSDADATDVPPRPGANAAQYVVLARRGYMRAKAGSFEKAILLFREAIRLNPGWAMGYRNLARALGEFGQIPEAIAAYRKAIEIEPEFAEAHYNLGWALREQDKTTAEAITAFKEAVRLKPDLWSYLSNADQQQVSDLVSSEAVYTGETPSPEAAAPPQLRMRETETIREFADQNRMTVAQLQEAAELWKATHREVVARETTGRATAEPRPKTIADAKAEALAIGDTTLLGQLTTYEARLASTDLPPEGLKSPEQAKAAARLGKTYQDLRARQLEWGLDPLPKDDRVAEAQRLAPDFYRKHPKPKVKATRSPLRRQRNSARTASPT